MTTKRIANQERKLCVLNAIREERDILFAPFSSNVSFADKIKAWERVLQIAKEVRVVDETRPWNFVRDKVWSVWKCRTLSKVDSYKKTGSAEGKDVILNPVDKLVLEIIDRKAPCVKGVNQVDCPSVASVEEECEPICFDVITQDPNESSSSDSIPIPIPSNIETPRVPTPKRKATPWISKIAQEFKEHKEELFLRKKKLKLQVENLEITNYKLKAELYIFEQQAGLQKSKFTECFEDLI